MYVIETIGLTRFFGDQIGIADLDLKVPPGSITAILGENASGKSTVIKLVMGLLFPNRGVVRVMGADPVLLRPAMKARIGFLTDNLGIDPCATLRQSLTRQASYYSTWSQDYVRGLLTLFELPIDVPYGTLSRGQRRRLMLLLALAHQPDLLVLDEPFDGIDSVFRNRIFEILHDAADQRQITILYTSRIPAEVEAFADRVLLLHHGRMAAQIEMGDFATGVKRLWLGTPRDVNIIKERFNVLSIEARDEWVIALVEGFDDALLHGIECEVETLNLEELFTVYTQICCEKQANA